MRVCRLTLLGMALSTFLIASSFAHEGELRFIPQVHDVGAMVIDGSDDDWGWMDQAFAFTSDMMTASGEEPDFTREDFDVAYFLGWSPPPDNRLYLFARVTDDVLDFNSDDPNRWWTDDSFNMAIDADHSGGNNVGTEIEHINNGQRWQVRLAPSPGGENSEFGTTGMYHGPSIFQGLPQLAWGHLPPFGEFASATEPAGSIHGATDVVYTYEFRMGIWDFYGLDAGESSRHINAIDDIIHFQTQFQDSDVTDGENPNGTDSQLTIGGNHTPAEGAEDHQFLEDVDAVDQPTAAEAVTWGRIKGHLQGQ